MKQAFYTLATLLLFAAPSPAQMQNISVRVDGLICPFCAYGLEKRLSKIDEVASVSIDQPQGLAILTMNPGQVVDFHEMTEAIIDSGFTPREIDFSATGRVENWNGRLTFVVPDNERFFLNDQDEQLATVVDTAELVTVTGIAGLSPEDDDGHNHPFTVSVSTVRAPQ